ncbi:MAG TPA: lactonase family protein [Verrucomicrobiales bacterium]|nr:lactonase family protein [Verrucomicrobiales bacterium]HIL71184.1 lactonase family protein [Verrucomicrobiota bacterium]
MCIMSCCHLVSLIGFIAAAQLCAADHVAYVSLAGENRIQTYRFNDDSGDLKYLDNVVTPGAPGSLYPHPSKKILYAGLRETGELASFKVDAQNGSLSLLNTVPVEVDPAYIRTDSSGKFLFSAYYVTGKTAVHPLAEDGSISSDTVQWFSTDKNAHAIVPDPSERYFFVPHTGPNAIFQFEWNSMAGKLTPNNPKRMFTPVQSGPRHIVFHRTNGLAYVDNEQGSSVTSFILNSVYGTLEAVQTLSTLPSGFKRSNTCADLELSPSGKFLYASNRGHDSIAGFAVNADNGELTRIGIFPTEETPRQFNISPSGKWMVVAGQKSGNAATYRIDSDTGVLTHTDTTVLGKQPWWILINSH